MYRSFSASTALYAGGGGDPFIEFLSTDEPTTPNSYKLTSSNPGRIGVYTLGLYGCASRARFSGAGGSFAITAFGSSASGLSGKPLFITCSGPRARGGGGFRNWIDARGGIGGGGEEERPAPAPRCDSPRLVDPRVSVREERRRWSRG